MVPTPAPAPVRTVLVVDDEVILGRSVKRMLAREYEVAVATSAREALDLFASGKRFDVILCDVMMPVMTGMDLFDELRRSIPEQAHRMVFVTGGAFAPRIAEFLDSVENLKLWKPFVVRQVLDAVRSAAER